MNQTITESVSTGPFSTANQSPRLGQMTPTAVATTASRATSQVSTTWILSDTATPLGSNAGNSPF